MGVVRLVAWSGGPAHAWVDSTANTNQHLCETGAPRIRDHVSLSYRDCATTRCSHFEQSWSCGGRDRIHRATAPENAAGLQAWWNCGGEELEELIFENKRTELQ